MIPLTAAAAAILVTLIAGILIGWDAAVHNHRQRRRQLEAAVNDLENQVAAMNSDLARDPQRAAIDIGKRYAVNAIQATLDRIMEAAR